ncbi:MAG TPA: hydroxymyristoyl-ACP dehydratase [Burkholderiales bacterium]
MSSLASLDIARLVPQQGPMCLLAGVERYDAQSIVCRADSHRDARNPLRRANRLPALAGIEYAAQALAAHCALLGGGAGRGLLAGVREVALHAERLDDVQGPLLVRAERLVADGRHLLYAFAVEAGGRALLSGRLAVVLDKEQA